MKVIFILLSIVILSHAIDISITPSKDNTVSNSEIDLLKASMMSQNIIIEHEQAEKVISENRYLCEEYLKKQPIPEKVISNFKLELEKHFASEIIRDMQRKIIIDDDTSYSYYISHLDEFKKPEQITFSLYKLENFDKALTFFSKFKISMKNIQSYSKENNISVISQSISLERLDNKFRYIVKHSKQKIPYLTPPQFFYNHYSVLEVVSQEPQGTYSYEEVKERIHKLLHKKAYSRQKDELLNTYRKQYEEG